MKNNIAFYTTSFFVGRGGKAVLIIFLGFKIVHYQERPKDILTELKRTSESLLSVTF